jgi:RNA-directed DNA polymerase
MPRQQGPSFKIRKYPKGNGKFRTIYMPNQVAMALLKPKVPALEAMALQLCPPDVVHGFWPARSCVTGALLHVGYELTVNFDLTDFFDHCTPNKCPLNESNMSFMDILFPDGAARQGLPTSPAIANICAAKLDWAIYNRCQLTDTVYTRYADDLTFSTDYRLNMLDLLEWVPQVVAEHGFIINQAKTHTQWAGAGRRVITGVAVDDTGVHPTRKTRRKLRAARHKQTLRPDNPHWKHRAAGLAEWAKCKLPGLGKRARKAIEADPQDCLQIATGAAQFAASVTQEKEIV